MRVTLSERPSTEPARFGIDLDGQPVGSSRDGAALLQQAAADLVDEHHGLVRILGLAAAQRLSRRQAERLADGVRRLLAAR